MSRESALKNGTSMDTCVSVPTVNWPELKTSPVLSAVASDAWPRSNDP
jgi:hypothetical protein